MLLKKNMELSFGDHARFKAGRRGIPMEIVLEVATAPQQIIPSTGSKAICQSKLFDSAEGKEMLFRVVVKDIGNLRRVITAYKTSKFEKYWRISP